MQHGFHLYLTSSPSHTHCSLSPLFHNSHTHISFIEQVSLPYPHPFSLSLWGSKIKDYYINHATLWKSQLQLADQQQIESCLVILTALLQY